MATDNRVLTGDKLIEQIASVLGVNGRLCRRIVLDINIHRPVTAYVEMFGSDKMLEINWAGELQGTTLKIVDEDKSNA